MITKTLFLAKIIHRIGAQNLRDKKSLRETTAEYRTFFAFRAACGGRGRLAAGAGGHAAGAGGHAAGAGGHAAGAGGHAAGAGGHAAGAGTHKM
jgi:hypothetical protein